jgi:opacity protein-like surface antigen
MIQILTLALVLVAAPAMAQRTEVTLLGGYTTSGDIDQKAAGIQELEVDEGFTWGVQAGHFFSDHIGAEISWSQQRSALELGTRDGSSRLFDMKLGALQGRFAYQFGGHEARIKPFLLAGLGTTFLSAEDLESETKLSWTVGAGVKWFQSRRLGARLQVLYAPTLLDDESSDVCDPFGFCQGSLHQFELMGGLVLRF